MSSVTDNLLRDYPIISDQVNSQELKIILTELEKILASTEHGSIVEFGCYVGTTSIFIQRMMNAYDAANEFHVYDSFEGLPPKTIYDSSPAGEQFKAGELKVSKKDFVRRFKKAGLALPYIHRGWFSDFSCLDIPENIIFAFLDGDYYQSIKDSLRLITPRLARNALIVVDDYTSESLPGAARAVDEWCLQYGYECRMQSSMALIKIS